MSSENTVNNMSEQDNYKTTAAIRASLKKRYARERRFQWYGRLAVLTGFIFLFVLLADIVSKGYPAFTQHYLNRITWHPVKHEENQAGHAEHDPDSC